MTSRPTQKHRLKPVLHTVSRDARGHGPGHGPRAEGLPVRRAAVQSRRRPSRADAHRDRAPAARLGTTTLYVTHDQVEAMTLADRLVILDGGRIQQIGAPLEVYRRPANRFVAGFIGTPPMNFVEGRLMGENGDTLGFRPEDVVLVPAGTAGSIPAQVALVELLGAHAHLHLDAGTQRLIAIVSGADAPAAGTLVHVSLDPSLAHRFDATGARLPS